MGSSWKVRAAPEVQGWLVSTRWEIPYANEWNILSWRGGGDFQELGHHPLFGLSWLASELSWCLAVCCLAYANILQWVYNEAQGLREVKSSAI